MPVSVCHVPCTIDGTRVYPGSHEAVTNRVLSLTTRVSSEDQLCPPKLLVPTLPPHPLPPAPCPKKWSKATPPVEKNWPQADDKTEKMRLPEKRLVQDVRHLLKYGHDSCIISAHTTREEHWLDLSNRPTQLKKTCVISGGERGVVLKNVVN